MAVQHVVYLIRQLFDGSFALHVTGERKRWWQRQWTRFDRLVYLQADEWSLSKQPAISLRRETVEQWKAEAERRLELWEETR